MRAAYVEQGQTYYEERYKERLGSVMKEVYQFTALFGRIV